MTKRGRLPIDMTNQRFGRLLVIGRALGEMPDGHAYWNCICDCGNVTVTMGRYMRSGLSKSCGCFRSEATRERKTTHGKTSTPEYKMLSGAKLRAKLQNIPFDLVLSDIVIPELCPILGTHLIVGVGSMGNDSPTLDKVIPEKGYVRGNVCVISLRANRMKSESSVDDIRKILDYIGMAR